MHPIERRNVNATAKWEAAKLGDMLARFESALGRMRSPTIVKELVFNRVRVLRADGYVGSVAFRLALAEHNLGHIN